MKTIKKKVYFGRGKRSEKVLREGEAPVRRGRVPRISKLMALAITFEELMRSGAVRTFAELAELGHVSPARITQVMNLLLLAPEIQERLLFLPEVESGRDPVVLREVRGWRGR
jgi:hypothetical protein